MCIESSKSPCSYYKESKDFWRISYFVKNGGLELKFKSIKTIMWKRRWKEGKNGFEKFFFLFTFTILLFVYFSSVFFTTTDRLYCSIFTSRQRNRICLENEILNVAAEKQNWILWKKRPQLWKKVYEGDRNIRLELLSE